MSKLFVDNFYPGPSLLHDKVEQHTQEAIQSGILSMNHRSQPFMDLYQSCEELAKKYWGIPEEYSLYFVSSSTECWYILSRALGHLQSLHLSRGAFADKWYQARLKCGDKAFISPGLKELKAHSHADFIAVTHNETSNGSKVQDSEVVELREAFPNALVALDACSSFGGDELPWDNVDIVFASVQKCLGLPSGMAILWVKNTAMKNIIAKESHKMYNSFEALHLNRLKWQTTHTPNILSIFLLKKYIEEQKELFEDLCTRLKKRQAQLYECLDISKYEPLVADVDARSHTVLALRLIGISVDSLFENLALKGIVVGKGYGQWKENSFRIANFPAVGDEALERLINELNTP